MFVDYLDRGLTTRPEATCIQTGDGKVTLTHQEVFDGSHRVAAALQNWGLGPGAKVAVFSPNDPAALVCVVGILRAGATWVALNPRSGEEELAALLDLVECDVLITHEAFADRGDGLASRIASLRRTAEIGVRPPVDVGDWVAPVGSRAAPIPFDGDSVQVILGTGGTTGRAKAVPITTRQLLSMCLAYNAHFREPGPPVYLMATPMTHAGGMAAWPVIAESGTVIVHDGVDPQRIFETIERNRVSRMFLPPTAIYTLLADPAVRDVDYRSLRYLTYAAAPMSADKLLESMDVFGPVMAQTFGQAEAPMICTYLSPAEHVEAAADPAKLSRLSSCGRQSLVATVQIMGTDGQLLGPGAHGEIVVRGDLVMSGYYRNPEASEETRRHGGWHSTSDIGYRDHDGFVYLVDRQRDVIISGGFNIYPSEVERVVWSHPAVLDCAVIGVPDEKWGEAVTAVVELKAGQAVEPQTLISLCKDALGSVQAPKSVIFRALPRSDNGKVLKRVLREEYWSGRARRI